MGNIFVIIISSMLVSNVVLSQFLGICPFLGVSKQVSTAVGMGAAVTFVITIASAITWPIYYFLLEPRGLDYLQTIVFILVIAALVQFVEMVLKKFMPSLHASLGVYLPLIKTDTISLKVLSVVFLQHLDFYFLSRSLPEFVKESNTMMFLILSKEHRSY